jgi:dipeptidyl aminopeptidase/acylaminoacyl peptidase
VRRRLAAILFLAAVTWLGVAASAHAAFPGANGRIAVNDDRFIYSMNPDGTGLVRLTTPSAGSDSDPAWSADGTKIALSRSLPYPSSERQIWTMNADGSNQTRLTSGSSDRSPAWSPDGTKIVFARANNIYTMNADGSGLMQLTNVGTGTAQDPAWSPDGTKIAFVRANNIWKMNPDGSSQVAVTTRGVAEELEPQWSPDGRKIVFTFNTDEDPDNNDHFFDVGVINPDGTNWVDITNTVPSPDEFSPQWSPDGQKVLFTRGLFGYSGGEVAAADPDGSNLAKVGVSGIWNPDWQPLPTAPYPYPASASTLNASLVPAFRQCGTGGNPANSNHSAPLSVGSCNPPRPSSAVAFVGPASTGSASFTVVPGDRDLTNGNQADVTLAASVTDVQTSSGGDYDPNASGPDLTEITRLQLTDTANGAYGGVAATAAGYDFEVPIGCSPTSDPSTGSTCSANTTANALLPGLVRENRRAILQAFRVRVDDSGTNGVRGDSDDRIFATQGVFAP